MLSTLAYLWHVTWLSEEKAMYENPIKKTVLSK
jgi:hypothetical protein